MNNGTVTLRLTAHSTRPAPFRSHISSADSGSDRSLDDFLKFEQEVLNLNYFLCPKSNNEGEGVVSTAGEEESSSCEEQEDDSSSSE